MNAFFTLKYAGNERTLADWGIESPQLSFVSRATDTLTFRVARLFDAAPLFATGATVEVYYNTDASRRRVFAGRVTPAPRSAGQSDEVHNHLVSGPQWYLENKVYQEFWAGPGAYKSRVQLTYDAEGEKMSAAATLSAILSYAIDAGAPFAIGNISAISGNIPSEEVGDRTCAEVIELVLRWYPDAVTWWDYSAATPTFNISTAATAVPADFSEAEELQYVRRDDIRVPGVAIKYEWIDNIDGDSIEVVTTDSAGDADGFGAMVVTVSLRGGSVSLMRQKLVSEYIDLDSKTWWKKNVPALKGVSDANLTIESIVRDERTDADGNSVFLPNQIIEGSHADWMPGDTGRVQITGRLRWRSGELERRGDFTVSGSGTSLGSKTYSKISSSDEREPLPVGIAARIFAALDRDHWEGSLAVVEQECSHWDLAGKAVRLLGASTPVFGPAQVQSVTMDILSGKTTVTFGPSPSLSAGDLVDLLRASRNRRDSSGGLKLRRSGASGTLDGPKNTANDAASAITALSHDILKGAGENPPKVTINFTTAPPMPDGVPDLTVQLREGIIIVNGVAKRAMVPTSEGYDLETS